MLDIFVIDDEELILSSLFKVLTKEGHNVEMFPSGELALEVLADKKPQLALLDLKLPGINGIEVLKRLKTISPATEVVMISAFGTVDRAVEAVKAGASDFLTKPLNLADIRITVSRIEETLRLKNEIVQIKEDQRRQFFAHHLIGQDPLVDEVYRLAGQVASNDNFTVLITGEPGSGKEMLARYIHYKSPCADGPFVPVNCAAIAKQAVETELFGARANMLIGQEWPPGYIESANGGTLFLDELHHLDHSVQVKLLRFLQDRAIAKETDAAPRPISVNVIGAANANVDKIVKEGKLREDLYFRINIVQLDLPPLSQRREDIPLFAKYYLDEFNKSMGRRIDRITDAAMEKLKSYKWPGNLRELKNAVERAYLLADGPVLDADHFMIESPLSPMKMYSKSPLFNMEQFPAPLKEINRRYAQAVLDRLEGNKSETARVLDISRNRLKRILTGE